jgi:hypothetical protein
MGLLRPATPLLAPSLLASALLGSTPLRAPPVLGSPLLLWPAPPILAPSLLAPPLLVKVILGAPNRRKSCTRPHNRTIVTPSTLIQQIDSMLPVEAVQQGEQERAARL